MFIDVIIKIGLNKGCVGKKGNVGLQNMEHTFCYWIRIIIRIIGSAKVHARSYNLRIYGNICRKETYVLSKGSGGNQGSFGVY